MPAKRVGQFFEACFRELKWLENKKKKKHHLVAHIASLGSGGVSGITYRPVLPRSPLQRIL